MTTALQYRHTWSLQRPLALTALILSQIACDATTPPSPEAPLSAIAGASAEGAPITPYDPLPLVDPLIATGGRGAEVASVSPGASAPFGLTLVGPDTFALPYVPPYHCAGYYYHDTHIQGFSHTHAHGMGVIDYGGVPLMPRAGWREELRGVSERRAPFSHSTEEASPGRYAVTLDDDGTRVEIIATPHGAHHRYTFTPPAPPPAPPPPSPDPLDPLTPDQLAAAPALIIDLGENLWGVGVEGAWARVSAGGEVELYERVLGSYSGRFGGVRHFAALKLTPAPTGATLWVEGGAPLPPRPLIDGEPLWVEGQSLGLALHFPPGTTQVDARVALSFVDEEGARGNLAAELPDLDLGARRAEVEALWRERLGRLRARGDEAHLRRFTTAHYHALLMPSRQDDADGRYRGLDDEIHTTDHPYYSDLSLWDTFRTLHPFYLLAHPDVQRDVLRSLLRMTRDGGSLPRWPLAHGYTGGMIGTPAAQLFSEAALKGLGGLEGLGGFDEREGFEACLAQATREQPHAGRDGLASYRALGYVPADEESRSVSLTLEYAWSDRALALWAEARGWEEAASLRAQSSGWGALWDAGSGFMVGRTAAGEPVTPRSDLEWSDLYVEGNAWHYLWYAPYDVAEMVALQHGGDAGAFLRRLREYWARVYAEPDDILPDDLYWHGNEPVMHYAWLGSLAGEWGLSVEASHWVLANRYGLTPEEGLDGNDDSGTLSAWYLWGAMGLYPIAGLDLYALGAPIFERVELDVEGGGLWVVEAPGACLSCAPREVWVGGERVYEGVGEAVLTHAQVLRGLRFER